MWTFTSDWAALVSGLLLPAARQRRMFARDIRMCAWGCFWRFATTVGGWWTALIVYLRVSIILDNFCVVLLYSALCVLDGAW